MGFHIQAVHQTKPVLQEEVEIAMASPTLPCELEGYGSEDVVIEEVAIKPVHTASQPVQQEKVAIPCPSQGCWYSTEKDEPAIAFEFFEQHLQQHHPQLAKAAMDISTKAG